MYDSERLPKCQHRFTQAKPLAFCRRAHQNLVLCRDLVEAGKIDYIFRCRRVRCSHECNAACMKKHSACVNLLLRDHVTVPVYRGHLRMPVDASPQDHKDAKEALLQTVRRWRKSTGHIIEIHAVQHITDRLNCHWDCVAYSDAPKKTLRSVISDAWRRAGGLRQSLVPMEASEVEAACRYQAKDIDPDRRTRKRYLPSASQGLQFHWSSRGFWQGHKRDDLWRRCIEEWFPSRESSNSKDTLLPSNTTSETSHPVDGKSVYLLLDNALTRHAVLAEIDRRIAALPGREVANLRAVLPATPVMVEELAIDACVTIDDAERYLRSGRVWGAERVEVARPRDPLPDAHGVVRPRDEFIDDYWYRS